MLLKKIIYAIGTAEKPLKMKEIIDKLDGYNNISCFFFKYNHLFKKEGAKRKRVYSLTAEGQRYFEWFEGTFNEDIGMNIEDMNDYEKLRQSLMQ
jgi:hypothetical protein